MSDRDHIEKKTPARKPYSKPTLNCYGKITQLTAGGSGMMSEGGGMMVGGGALNPTRFP